MPSPFPGMDPYIEANRSWSGFHTAFLVACMEQLNRMLPRHYIARVEERLQVLSEDEERELQIVPDSVVARTSKPKRSPPVGTEPVATLEPTTLPQDVQWLDEPTETFIRLFRFPDERVVTGLEMLSPSNKSGKGRAAYLAKRFEYRHQHINLVELDLLLAGERVPLLAPLPSGDYFAFVTRAPTRHECAVYAWSVRDPLPTIPVPLEPGEDDVPLDLKAAFDRTYEGGRYDMQARYLGAPPAQLNSADRAWAMELAARAET